MNPSAPDTAESGDWSRLLVEAAPNAMIMIDRQRRIVLLNQGAEKLFGFDRTELLGEPVERLVPERHRERHPIHVAGFFFEPKTRAMGAGRELYGLRKDGTEVPIEIGLNPIDTPGGAFTLASIIDITERRRAEERFRVAVEAAPNAMLIVDKSRRITLVNRKTEELFGYERAELLGQFVEVLVPERFRSQHPAFVEVFGTAPKARPMGAGRELFGRRKDGLEVPVEIGLNPIETADGPVTLASIIDISERKRAEAIQQRLATIVESSNDAIMSKSLDGVITSWNRGAEHLFGYSAEEALGQSILLLVPERLVDDEREVLGHIQRGESMNHFETVRRRKDGSEIDVSIQISPLRDGLGEVVGSSLIARDITELKRRDADLQRSNAELEQFAYVASHDLQEPLRMVANYTELLAERYQGKLDEKADRYIHFASDGARRMQRLVTDLLAYSRVGSQGKPFAAVRVNDVLDKVLDSIEPLISESKARIDRQDLPTVLADEVQLHQLLQNLLGNAIKFRADHDPHIEVSARREGAFWRMSVRDNGIGVDMQYAERIFQMFQRLHEIGKYTGSGIGLAISKRIVERHGGSIWIESQPGQGATFHFTLRAAPQGEAP